MTWTVTEEPRLRGYAVEWLDSDTMLLSRRNQLYRVRGAALPQRVGRIHVPWWEGLASRVRLAQRLLIFVPVSNQFQAGYDASLYNPQARFVYLTASYKFF